MKFIQENCEKLKKSIIEPKKRKEERSTTKMIIEIVAFVGEHKCVEIDATEERKVEGGREANPNNSICS